MEEFITEKELEARAKKVFAPIPMPSGQIEYHRIPHESVTSYQAMREVGVTGESIARRAVEMQEQTGMSYPFCFAMCALKLPDED